MKYQLGQQVWHAGWSHVNDYVTCPDCAGEGRIRVLLPDDTQVSVDCVGCQSGCEPPKGYLVVHKRTAKASAATITGFEMNDGKMEWRTSSHYRTSEENIFDTEEEARAAAALLAEAADKEERDRIQQKEKPSRSWAWHAHYHRKSLKEAKRLVEYHTAKLNVSNLKSREAKVT